ncbi:MAG TPA: hypothetical protein VF793_10250, partial [Telluria sp.]
MIWNVVPAEALASGSRLSVASSNRILKSPQISQQRLDLALVADAPEAHLGARHQLARVVQESRQGAVVPD